MEKVEVLLLDSPAKASAVKNLRKAANLITRFGYQI
jgi:hypothetical protein